MYMYITITYTYFQQFQSYSTHINKETIIASNKVTFEYKRSQQISSDTFFDHNIKKEQVRIWEECYKELLLTADRETWHMARHTDIAAAIHSLKVNKDHASDNIQPDFL